MRTKSVPGEESAAEEAEDKEDDACTTARAEIG
jgi:hypothetical protein